jgi:hypothetical protein
MRGGYRCMTYSRSVTIALAVNLTCNFNRDPPRAMSLGIMLTPTEGRLNRYEVQVTL